MGAELTERIIDQPDSCETQVLYYGINTFGPANKLLTFSLCNAKLKYYSNIKTEKNKHTFLQDTVKVENKQGLKQAGLSLD